MGERGKDRHGEGEGKAERVQRGGGSRIKEGERGGEDKRLYKQRETEGGLERRKERKGATERPGAENRGVGLRDRREKRGGKRDY